MACVTPFTSFSSSLVVLNVNLRSPANDRRSCISIVTRFKLFLVLPRLFNSPLLLPPPPTRFVPTYFSPIIFVEEYSIVNLSIISIHRQNFTASSFNHTLSSSLSLSNYGQVASREKEREIRIYIYIFFHRRHRDAVDPFSTRKFEDSDGRSRIEESQNRARDRAFFQSCREKGKGQKDSVELALPRTCPPLPPRGKTFRKSRSTISTSISILQEAGDIARSKYPDTFVDREKKRKMFLLDEGVSSTRESRYHRMTNRKSNL